MQFLKRHFFAIGFGVVLIAGIGILLWSGVGDNNTLAQIPADQIKFNGARSYGHLVDICKIGPRVSGTVGMQKQQELLIEHFKGLGGTVVEQKFRGRNPSTGKEVPLTNLIVQWHPDKKKRIVLACHYDTRPFPDQDKTNPRGTFIGANDGASGVALLMELGRYMPELRSNYGVDFVFFDAEELVYDNDRDPYFLGSEYFARQYRAEPPPYRYHAGIVLDMVADKELHLFQEKGSLRLARGIVKDVWNVARALGVKEFIHRSRYDIRDDHLALNTIAGIRTIDIIDFDYPRPGGPNYWHTTQDVPENCSGESLEKVGKVVHAWLMYLK